MTPDSVTIFQQIFGEKPALCGFAPGRVNIIGEHTDYNGGCVFPCALKLGIEGAAKPRKDRLLRFYSANFPGGVTEISLDALALSGNWSDYPVSVFKAFAAMGYAPQCGADFAFAGNLPDGAGLSSSAALEVLTGLLLRELYGFSVTAQELAVFGQFAENRFIGVNCGIMDQFVSAVGRRGCAVLLNSATLDYAYAPIPQDRAALVIVNSGVKHSLASSAYNDRRRECETALAQLNRVTKAPSLCALSVDAFEEHKNAIESGVCRRRAKHAVYENARTRQAAEALGRGDLEAFGALMKQSHISLRDDYEVSCPELDFLAETAWRTEGVFGARMTGGGFGGCTVNLVKPERTGDFCSTIQKEYQQQFGAAPQVIVTQIGDGARLRNIE